MDYTRPSVCQTVGPYRVNNAILTLYKVGFIKLIMLFIRVPPEDTVGFIKLIMLFVRVPPEDTVGEAIGAVWLSQLKLQQHAYACRGYPEY